MPLIYTIIATTDCRSGLAKYRQRYVVGQNSAMQDYHVQVRAGLSLCARSPVWARDPF